MLVSSAQITPWQTFSNESLRNHWAAPLKQQVCYIYYTCYRFDPGSLRGRFIDDWDRLNSF